MTDTKSPPLTIRLTQEALDKIDEILRRMPKLNRSTAIEWCIIQAKLPEKVEE